MKLEPEKILNLSGIVVKRFEEIEGYGLFFDIEVSSKQARCPRCNKVSRSLHQNHWRVVRDLPISDWEVFLRINRRQ